MPRSNGVRQRLGGRDVGTLMKQPRWVRKLVGGLLTAACLTGCQQQLFLEPSDYQEALKTGIPERLETHPHDPIPPSVIPNGPGPATVLDPTRKPRPMTLKEAIAIAVEQGNIGAQGVLINPGFANDNLVQFGGRAVGGTDTIRALVLDPAIVGADIERAMSKFDTRWITSMSWSKQDQATLTLQQSFSNGDNAQFSSTLAKPLPTGGLAGITFNVNYLNLSEPPQNQQFVALATSYTPRLQFVFEQPLLQSFGVEINQLTPGHPGSFLIPGLRPSGGTTTEGILITRIRYEQQKAEFDRQINNMLLNVEAAYWNLYAAYYNLYAQEDVLRQSYDLLSILTGRLQAGAVAQQDVAQTEAQYYRFRRQVINARQQVLNAERQLRGMLGMRSDNSNDRIVPIDEPTLAPFMPDYYELANEALSRRPELILARHDVKFRQLDLILQKNQRRPDLRFFSSYDINGLGSRLDGPQTRATSTTDPITGLPSTSFTPVNAFSSLTANQFNSWQLGIRMDVPLGFRDANAAVRQAQLNLYRSYYQLHDSERKVLEICTDVQREVIQRYENIKYARAERLELQRTLELFRALITGGQWNVNSLFNVLQVQQQVASAISAEFAAVAEYNIALAKLENAKGTIQGYNNVSINEGPLPSYVGKKAADHFRERAAAIKVRERSTEEMPHITEFSKPWEPITDKPVVVPAPLQDGDPGALPAPRPLPQGQPMPEVPAPRGTPSPTGPITQGMPQPQGISAPSFTIPQTTAPVGMIETNPVTSFTPVDTVRLPQRGSTVQEPSAVGTTLPVPEPR